MNKENKIKNFLLIGFLGNFILIVLIVSIALIEIKEVKSNFRSNYERFALSLERLDSVKILYSIDINLNKWQKITKNHILIDDSAAKAKIRDIISGHKQSINEDIEEYKLINANDIRDINLVNHLSEEIADYERLNNEVLELSDKNQMLKALLLSNTTANTEFNIAETDLIKIINSHINERILEEKAGLEIYNESLDILALTITSISILGFLTCVISIILAISSYRIISKSYQGLAEKEQELQAHNKQLMEKESELKNKNAAIIKAKEKLEIANRELIIINKSLRELDEMKTNFVSTVSHELRTPLTAIKGSLGLILNNVLGEVDGETSKFLTICYRNTDRLIRLINELLDISKIESGKINLEKTTFNLSNLIFNSLEGVGAFAIERKVQIYSNVESNIEVYGDHDRIDQILYNLLSNAIKFSSISEDRTGRVEIFVKKEDGYTVVSISDNGIGIPKEMHDKVFDKFSQLDNTSTRLLEGSGLGLAICKALVQEHKGKIWIENNEHSGTTVHFSIAARSVQEMIEQASKTIDY